MDDLNLKYIPFVLTRIDKVYIYFNDSSLDSQYYIPFERVPKPKTENDCKMTYEEWDTAFGSRLDLIQEGSLVQARRKTCVAHVYLRLPS